MNEKACVVSIHDVSPWTRERVDSMLERLAGLGVERTSLLVVPDHHHRGHFSADPGFCEWMRGRVAAGHEAVIHGYFHQREAKGAESWLDRAVTRVYTAGEGEFYDMEEEEAAERFTKARNEFQREGIMTAGFIAPAWLLSKGAERALKRLGCEYTTRLGGVTDLRIGREHASQSLVYSVRSRSRRKASLAWNAILYRRLGSNPLLRASLHPPDIEHPDVWRQILLYLSGALERRKAMTYEEWVTRTRTDPPRE